MTILSNVDYFKELPFYNVSIEKPKIKRLRNIDVNIIEIDEILLY